MDKMKSRKAMEGSFVFKLMMFLLVSGMVLVAVSLFNSGRSFSAGLNNQSASWNYQEAVSHRDSFTLESVRYAQAYPDANSDELCENSSSEVAIVIDLYLKLNQVPESCDVFINNKLSKTLDFTNLACSVDCPQGDDMVSSLSYGPVPSKKSHFVEICCEGSCADRTLPPACS